MRFALGTRRAALDGLSKILDAGSLEELFTGPDAEAAFLYDLLVDAARARSSSYYWEICRTARRRGVTPEYIIDRAVVLLASMTERRRTDLYRLLGVAPLCSGEALRQRWIEFAKREHPDVGGDAALFRRVKEAYEILRDPERRAEYERFWVRALGPFERVAPPEDAGPVEGGRRLEAVPPTPRRSVAVWEAPADAPAPEPEPPQPDAVGELLHAAARLFAARDDMDRRLGGGNGGGLAALLGNIEAALAPVTANELNDLRREVANMIATFEQMRANLATLATIKQQVGTLAYVRTGSRGGVPLGVEPVASAVSQ